MDSIIVFSHLRWDFVYQRPQHLLSRLATHYRILFFEEPEYRPGKEGMEISNPLPNLTVCKPITPVDKPGFNEQQMPYLRPIVRQLSHRYEEPIVWFYTPMGLPLLAELKPQHIVYDCMDELSAFKKAPPGLVQRENELFRIADVVFTGGPSLYHAKKHRNPNVHCFPSSVDVAHFRQALDRNIAHPTHDTLPRPRLGYYGVIDERFDADIIAQLATTHPEWHIVLVGPIAKINTASLPLRPNISYMGQQPYSALPQFLAAWDVCLMPFAMNEATRFISPTKSLEYMAAELPIVSTPIKDVVDLHSDVVEIADSTMGFVSACEHVLSLASHQMRNRIRLMRNKLLLTSWDSTAAKMHALLMQLNAAKLTRWDVRNALVTVTNPSIRTIQ
jgi:UDP-galactopyranose mutase